MTPAFVGLDDPAPDFATNAALAIGNFDGVHRGHHRLIAVLRAEARRLGAPAVAVCLYPHPLALLRPHLAPITLLWPERRADLLRAAGADAVLFLRTTPELLSLTAGQFFDQVLMQKFKARALVEGENFRFGRGRDGDVSFLKTRCRQAAVSMVSVALADDDEAAVSSTRIRQAVASGDLDSVFDLSGRRHRIRGVVGTGAQRGRTIGFPTANLKDAQGVTPAHGVYSVHVHLADGRSFAGACNVGPNPTFNEMDAKIETHLLEFSGDLYGEAVEIEFVRRIRDVRSFASSEALVAQIRSDVESVRTDVRSSSDQAILSELAGTIAEWVRWDAGGTLEAVGIALISATFIDQGVLRLAWNVPTPTLPQVVFDLLFGMEERLRSAFPEVRHVVPSTV